jgi:cell division initiation protein
MEKFTRTLRGYDPDEVNHFIDQVISQVEIMVNDIKSKNKKIAELSSLEEENAKLKEKLATYERMEGTLNRAILMAEKTSEQIKLSAHQESETIINDAKRNANRIVNDALLRAEKTEMEADMLRRNITIFKRKLKSIIEAQLDMVNDIEKVDF